MSTLILHEFHHSLFAHFGELDGVEVVNDYGDWLAEHAALRESAGVLDLSFRSRICLTGADRVRYLHGQVTNDIKKLGVGQGCYVAIVTTKGKMESDANVFVLQDEVLLDMEPGLTARISQRLEKFIVADDVQIVDVAPHYGLLTVQGPKAEEAVRALGVFNEVPTKQFESVKVSDGMLGEIYLIRHARLNTTGFDLFVPNNALGAVADKLVAAAKAIGGRACGWQAFDTARIEAGIPRFGVDMDETNLPLEAGLEKRAVSYSKGCYIGQEVINRVHSIGHVNKELRQLRLVGELLALPVKGDKLFQGDHEAGYVTSVVRSPTLKAVVALGYVRREAGVELKVKSAGGECAVTVEGI